MHEGSAAAGGMSFDETRGGAATDTTFDGVYRANLDRVHRFCASQVGAVAADDVVAETFLRAWRAWPRLRSGPDAVVPWLLRIARNVAANHRRGVGRRREGGLARDRPARTDIEDEVVTRLELATVERVLWRLGDRDRLLIGLRCAADLTHAEIGLTVGIAEGAARVAVHRALQRLRATLEDEA
ncbi:MAG: hypothetical protein DLM65_05540 [Candidatus Aeolococcus gillhamiae]|uniref:Uncharacterized protein n=1 Tax=Candidatus Aeolococcus gillhamiae TaxID=3127015 RepID=A0A2W5ZF28_9BACT|nr:MAG: hypothetical protein DLM65_05540 [Candidatus Dormibacter sp. RRmetagenome_bin12]